MHLVIVVVWPDIARIVVKGIVSIEPRVLRGYAERGLRHAVDRKAECADEAHPVGAVRYAVAQNDRVARDGRGELDVLAASDRDRAAANRLGGQAGIHATRTDERAAVGGI